jgi:thiol-disulfide isomerase/thioredoxin
MNVGRNEEAGMKKHVFAVLLMIIGCAAGFIACESFSEWQKARNHKAKFLNKPAPAFETTTVDGLPWRLGDAAGKVVLIDFWATWCPDCVVTIPAMKKIHEQYGGRDDFLMVGVSLDGDADPLRKMTGKKGMTWLQLFEEGKKWENSVADRYEIHWIPSVWVIDKDGITRGMNLHDEAEIVEALENAF